MKFHRINEEHLKTLNLPLHMQKKAWEAATEVFQTEGLTASAEEIGSPEVVVSGEGYFEPSDLTNLYLEKMHTGGEFAIDILIPEEVTSGDGRTFKRRSVDKVDGPMPLLWQQFGQRGHDGSMIVGRIDHVERLEGTEPVEDEETGILYGWGRARGVFDTGAYGREAERLVRNGFLWGVSADMDQFEAQTEITAAGEEEDDGVIKSEPMTVSKARLIAATLVSKPAFQEAKIRYVEPIEHQIYELPIEDGMYEEEYEDEFAMSAALTASAAPVVPPADWFKNPELTGPTPLTVDDDGRVFGHIAAWNVDHIGLPRATKPPRSRSNYAYFRTGVVRTDNGKDVPVGQLTLAGGHASLHASAEEAVKHYDDTASAVADVAAGEDAYGIWVAGALRPSVTAEQVRVLRASAPSGDWRPINGRLELVAICQVNVPGFPTARSMVAGGQVTALVAAGARPLAEIRQKTLEERVAALETKQVETEFAAQLEELDAKFAPLLDREREALAASAKPSKEFLESLRKEDEEAREARAAALREVLDRLA